MKLSGAILLLCLALLVPACGDDAATSSSDEVDPRFATISGGEGAEKPKIVPPDLPPPKKPISRDLEVGTGEVADRGDLVTLYYYSVNYETGKEEYSRWRPGPPTIFRLGSESLSPAWENEIVGMKEGGRREAIIPSRLLFYTGTFDYVLELKAAEEIPE